MNFNLNVYENQPTTSPTPEVADKQIRVFFDGAADGGHVSGPFTATQAADAAIVALSREDVVNVVVEEVV